MDTLKPCYYQLRLLLQPKDSESEKQKNHTKKVAK